MAVYKFKCIKCKKTEEKEIPMADYDKEKNNQICKCGEKMQRVFESIGDPIYNCGGFYVKP